MGWSRMGWGIWWRIRRLWRRLLSANLQSWLGSLSILSVALSSKSSYNRLMIKNNLKGHLILSFISVANASVWYFFFQQINTYINN
jgi:hypothetical protein